MAPPSPPLLLSSILFLSLLLPSPSAANEGNILVTGDVLSTDSQLSAEHAVLVIQNDCNFVLYNKGRGFQSGTSGRGTNCILSISEYGQLTVKEGNGSLVWQSSYPRGPEGEYAAILQPDGQVGVYGPVLWSTPRSDVASKRAKTAAAAEANFDIKPSVPNLLFSSEALDAKSKRAKTAAAADENFDIKPSVPNLLFSSGALDAKSKLVSRDYALGVEGCALKLTKADRVVWGSPDFGANNTCFARLNFRGELTLLDDFYRTLWSTSPASTEGVYVLAVKINGQATIYNRRIWSSDA